MAIMRKFLALFKSLEKGKSIDFLKLSKGDFVGNLIFLKIYIGIKRVKV